MASSSSQAFQILNQYQHRSPLDGDQIRALCNALTSLNQLLGDDNAIKTSIYCSILRLLKAHVTPFPINASVTFSQVQAARLQLLAEKLLSEGKPFPTQLIDAIREGLVSGFNQQTREQIPLEQQKQQLAHQQYQDRQKIYEERTQLQERQADFSRARAACLNAINIRKRQLEGPDPDTFIPWEQRTFKLDQQPNQLAPIDQDTLLEERNRILKHNTQSIINDITTIFKNHQNGINTLSPRYAALLETRIRHANLLQLQAKMRHNIYDEYQMSMDRDNRGRGSRGRARTLKQLQREFEKVERAKARQIESEERDARRKRQAWMNAMIEHLNKFRSYHRDVVRRGMRAVTKAVLKHHEELARNTNRAEREAERARIQKLKEDDEEGYLELVRKTKNTRLLELLDQTDKYLKELGAVVREERAKSGVVEYEKGRENKGSRVNYYEIAHAIKEDVRLQSALCVGGKLKEYQLTGIQWMVSLYNNRLNGILADEMGLGKTIQTIGLIAHLMETKDNPGPYLIIVPLSTISNWEAEFARWAPVIRVIVFKGDAKARRKLYEEVIEKKSFNVCLVTYEYVVRGKNLLKRVEWQHLIIDEGHRIKNHESRLSAVLHAHYRSRNRLLLTGTPLQNSLTELWALLNFLLPNVFKSAESFESWFAAPFAQMGVGNVANTGEQAQLSEEESLLIIRRLHQVLRPFLLRRLKSDVLRMGEQLPEKQEHNLMCEMSAWQKNMYLKILKSECVLFTDRHGRHRYDKLPNPAIQLRKCVNHPYLFFADHASQLRDSPQLWRSSGKFDMLDAIITKFLRTGHRLLIFNQMTKVVDLQERLLRYRNIPFYRLDGTTSTDERKQMVNDFNDENTDINVFLLTTRAGGLGVNLQTADTVIIFDSDWNPSMDQQAQDRAHRIGQRKEVLVIRMLTAKSIEEIVLERASFKRGLEKKIIRAGMFDEQSKDSERQAMLRELLRVEGGSDDEQTEDGIQTDEELNRLLARSEEEFEKFMIIDKERKEEIGTRPRLVTEKEIPEWAVKVPKALLQKAKISGAGSWARDVDGVNLEIIDGPKKKRRATANVSYSVDQISERQYLKLIERSEAGEQLSYETLRAAGQRKKRRKKGSKKETGGGKDDASNQASNGVNSEDASNGGRGGNRLVGAKSLKVKVGDEDMSDHDDDDSDVASGDDLIDDDDDDDDDEDGNPYMENGVDSDKDVESPKSDADFDSDISDGSASHSISPAVRSSRGRKRGPGRGRAPSRTVRKRMRRTPSSPPPTSRSRGEDSISKRTIESEDKSDSSDESAAPIRRSLTRKRPKASSSRATAKDDGNGSSGDEAISTLKPPSKKPRAAQEYRTGRIHRLDRGNGPKENLHSRFNEKSPIRRVRSAHEDSAASLSNHHENNNLAKSTSPKKASSAKHGATRKGQHSMGKGILTTSRFHADALKKIDRERSLNSHASSSKIQTDKNSNRYSSSPSKAFGSKRSVELPKSSPSKIKPLPSVPRKPPSSSPSSTSGSISKVSNVPVGFPKLSRAPLSKKLSSQSSDGVVSKSHKSSDSKLSSPPKTIDEASLPVLGKIPLSFPRKNSHLPSGNVNNPASSSLLKSSTIGLSSMPIPSYQTVASAAKSGGMSTHSKNYNLSPTSPGSHTASASKAGKIGGMEKKTSESGKGSSNSNSRDAASSKIGQSSALKSSMFPSYCKPPTMNSRTSSNTTRPVLSSVPLISSKPNTPAKILMGSSSLLYPNIPKSADSGVTERNRTKDEKGNPVKNISSIMLSKRNSKADSLPEPNGNGNKASNVSSYLMHNDSKRSIEPRRTVAEGIQMLRKSAEARRRKNAASKSDSSPEREQNSKEDTATPINAGGSRSSGMKLTDASKSSKKSVAKKTSNATTTATSISLTGEYEPEDGEIREDGELSEGSGEAEATNESTNKPKTDGMDKDPTPATTNNNSSANDSTPQAAVKTTDNGKNDIPSISSPKPTTKQPRPNTTPASPPKQIVSVPASAPVTSTSVRSSSTLRPMGLPPLTVGRGASRITRPGPMPVRASINPETLKAMRVPGVSSVPVAPGVPVVSGVPVVPGATPAVIGMPHLSPMGGMVPPSPAMVAAAGRGSPQYNLPNRGMFGNAAFPPPVVFPGSAGRGGGGKASNVTEASPPIQQVNPSKSQSPDQTRPPSQKPQESQPVKPLAQPKPQPPPNPQTQPDSKPQAELQPNPQSQPQPQSQSQPQLQPKPKPKPSVQTETKAQPQKEKEKEETEKVTPVKVTSSSSPPAEGKPGPPEVEGKNKHDKPQENTQPKTKEKPDMDVKKKDEIKEVQKGGNAKQVKEISADPSLIEKEEGEEGEIEEEEGEIKEED